MYTITLKQNFPLRTVFAVSEKFGYVVSIFLEPLAGLCYHLHSGKVTGCVPWQGDANGWTAQPGRSMVWALQLPLVW